MTDHLQNESGASAGHVWQRDWCPRTQACDLIGFHAADECYGATVASAESAAAPEAIAVVVRRVAGPWQVDGDWRVRDWAPGADSAAIVRPDGSWSVWVPGAYDEPIARGQAPTLAEAQAAADAALIAYCREASR